jgi:hypothetical protein
MTMFSSFWMANAGGADAFSVDNSMLLNDDDSQYLIRENASNSTTGGDDARKKFTVSLWWKHGNIPSGGQNLFIQRNSSSNYVKCAIAGSGGNEGALQFFSGTLGVFSTGDTSAILRDFHAWYHILFYYDSTDSTAGDRARIYLNGTRLTDFQTSATNPSSGAITQFGSNNAQVIGQNQGASGYSDGYMAEMVVIDGQALTPDNFTETDSNGVLRPLDISAQGFTFGDQGFYLPFSNSAELGVGAGPASSTAATVSFLQVVRDSGSSTNYTFSSQNLGTAASDRIIAVHVASERSSAGARTVSSLTVAGVSAALVVRNTSPNGDTHELWEAQVPSGTSGDVVVNHSGSMTGSSIALYAIYNARYQDHYTVTDTGTTLSQTLVIPENSIAIAGASDVDADIGTGNFTGVTERFDQAIDVAGNRAIAGGDTSTNSGTGATTIAFSGASSTSADDAMFAATWFPSDGPNNFTSVNSPTQTSDSPTKNYAVLSPLSHQTNGSLSKGNTQTTASSDQGMSFSSFPVTTGQKVYIEAIVSGSTTGMTGCVKATSAVVTRPNDDFDDLSSANNGDARLLHTALGDVFNSDGNTTVTNYAPNDAVPVHLMIALDLVNDKIYWGDAGVGSSGWSNGSGSFNQSFDNAVGVDLDANLDWFFAFRPFSATIEVNFGATAFTVSPPTGYSSGYSAAIENENRETALTIEDGSAYFQTSLYSGNSSTQTITQSGFNSTFQPDLIWGKQRTGSQEPTIFDAVRGTTKYIQTNSIAAEATQSGVTAFNSNGFDLGSWAVMNESSNNHVAWQWLAGNSTSTPSGGSVSSTVSVNQTAGFSIVSWTGTGANATIAHGLNAVPSWIIIKNRDSAGNNWPVYHVGQGNTHVSFLDSANAMTAADRWQDTTPTSTVFSVDGTTDVNKSTDDMIAYCWCGKPGFSKFGSYEGNNSANGIVIDLGFKPALFIAKNIDATGAWLMFDSAREPFNLMDLPLEADDNKAEAASGGRELDFLSSGVKLRGNSSYLNSNHTFIYMAFAENPFAGTTPATAR